ncbi:hypothetical protein NL676_024722 [Syzygium grande]|nr:hypothetical protein NL676_024722 [Syzygium grande]
MEAEGCRKNMMLTMWMAMLVLSWAPSTSVGQAVPCKLVCVVECFFSGSPLDCYNDCVKRGCGGSSSGVLSKSSNCIAACVPVKCFDPSSGANMGPCVNSCLQDCKKSYGAVGLGQPPQ